MTLLIIAWSLFKVILCSWAVLAVIIFFILLRITAPYGRYSSAKWGPMVNNRFGWFIMECTVLIALAIMLIPSLYSVSVVSWVMVGLFCLHYLNRTFIFPFRLHSRGKMMPWLVVGSGIFFNVVNGFSLGYYFAHFAHYTTAWF